MTEFKHVRLDGKVYTKTEIKKIIKEQNVKFIKLQFVDVASFYSSIISVQVGELVE